jgi:hypothetical protein
MLTLRCAARCGTPSAVAAATRSAAAAFPSRAASSVGGRSGGHKPGLPQPAADDVAAASSDVVRLAVTLLRKAGGSLHPAILMQRMQAARAAPGASMQGTSTSGAASTSSSIARLPAGINFARMYPAVFAVEWEEVAAPAGGAGGKTRNARAIRLLPAASGLVGRPPAAAAAAAAGGPAAAVAQPPSTPPPVVERTDAPEAGVWGPIIEEEAAAAGGFLPISDVRTKLQGAALRRGLPLPPAGLQWFLMTPHPAYARLLPVWAPRTAKDGVPQVEGVRLLPPGQDVLAHEFAQLRKLAEEVEGGASGVVEPWPAPSSPPGRR